MWTDRQNCQRLENDGVNDWEDAVGVGEEDYPHHNKSENKEKMKIWSLIEQNCTQEHLNKILKLLSNEKKIQALNIFKNQLWKKDFLSTSLLKIQSRCFFSPI